MSLCTLLNRISFKVLALVLILELETTVYNIVALRLIAATL